MPSSIGRPQDNMAWFVSGNNLGIVTKSSGHWAAIDETVAEGILVHYFGEPELIPVDQPEQCPDIPSALHSALVDYIKGQLFLDKAGEFAQLPETAAIYLSLSREHMRRWKNMVARRLPTLTTKIAGPRSLVPLPVNRR